MDMGVVKVLRSRTASCLKKCTSPVRCCGGERRARSSAWGCSERLLLHISCLLALFGGAGLATCARLKWDPSAYVALRELFPAEYRAVCAALPAYCAAAVALTHLAVSALLARRRARRLLLCVYAVLTLTLVVCELALAGWLAARLARWLRSPEARRLLDVMDFKDYFLGPALSFLGRFIPVSRKAKALMDEADADAPYNLYCACGAGVAAVLLQLLAAALALCPAPPAPPATPCWREQQRLQNGGSHRGSSTYIDMVPLGGAAPAPRPPPPLLAPVL